MNQIKYILLSALLALSACGYHLRGSLELPAELRSVYIEGASSQLHEVLQKSTRATAVTLASHATEAGMVVKIVKEKMRSQVLSLSVSGRANEYTLHYVLDFLLLDAQGKPLAKTQSIEISRDYFNDQQQLLGKNNEEQVIKAEIYRQAANAILNKFRIILNQPPSN